MTSKPACQKIIFYCLGKEVITKGKEQKPANVQDGFLGAIPNTRPNVNGRMKLHAEDFSIDRRKEEKKWKHARIPILNKFVGTSALLIIPL